MKFILYSALMLLAGGESSAQLSISEQKEYNGWLFLSNENFQYDWKEGVSEIRNLGFHDFFFPVNELPLKSVLDSNISIILKNGIRIDYLNNRGDLKSKAQKVNCKDTSGCYRFKEFYLLPVSIRSTATADYEPFVCNRNYFELKVLNGCNLRFEYQHAVFMKIDTIVIRK